MYIFTRKDYRQCIMAAITESHMSKISMAVAYLRRFPETTRGDLAFYFNLSAHMAGKIKDIVSSTRPTDERLPHSLSGRSIRACVPCAVPARPDGSMGG